MKRLTATWTTALATAALLALPAASGAQTPQTPPEPQPTQSTTLSTPAGQNENESPAEHLQQAKAALANIDVNTVPARAQSQIAALRRHMNALERSVAANDKASATGAAQRSSKATSGSRGKTDWANDVAAIDRIITELAGSGSTSMTGTGDPSTAGTSGTSPRGTAGSKSEAVMLDDAARNQLLEVRTHITAFAAAMSGSAAAPSPSASTPSATEMAPSTQTPASSANESKPEPKTDPASPTPSQTESTPSQTEPTPSQAEPTPSQTPGDPDALAPAQPQVDEEAAKRHLTAARDTLTQITQLPAAAQLQGDARVQVSQLIQNFNELITTQTDWRTTYEKLEANLTALIGPPPEEAGAASTPPPATETPEATPQPAPTDPTPTPQPETPAPTGTQGTQSPEAAVGTSGTAAATIDPAIREKLVEFRQHLLAFHDAAGGGAKK